MGTSIDIVNASTFIGDADLARIVDALQTQVSRHWAPEWGSDATLELVSTEARPRDDQWWLVVCDTSDAVEILGYYDSTSAGLPLSKIFSKSHLSTGLPLSLALSHEVLELLGDPDISRLVAVDTAPHIGFYAFEVCDPVGAVDQGYAIDEAHVPYFVFPSSFNTFLPPVP